MFGSGFNVTNNFPGAGSRYTIHLLASSSTYAAGSTRFFGYFVSIVTSVATTNEITILRGGTITGAMVELQAATAGSGEAWSMFVRLNDTTDFLIATVSSATNRRTWFNNAMSIRVTAGDRVVIKSIAPAFAVLPSAVLSSGYLIVD